jgi:hypothetical protein
MQDIHPILINKAAKATQKSNVRAPLPNTSPWLTGLDSVT